MSSSVVEDSSHVYNEDKIAYTLHKLVHLNSVSHEQISSRREAREAFMRTDSNQSKYDPSGGGGGGGGREQRTREKDSNERERENIKEKLALNGSRPMNSLSEYAF